MVIHIFLFLLAFADSNTYTDLTPHKWTGVGDPPLWLTDVRMSRNCQICDPKYERSVLRWTYSTHQHCERYTMKIRIADRNGKLILEEEKRFSFGKGGVDEFNRDSSNIVHSGQDHAARLNKNVHKRTFLKIDYWLVDAMCREKKEPVSDSDPDRRAFTLEDILKSHKKPSGK